MSEPKKDKSVLLIYTGGTIGMNHNPKTNTLEPVRFELLESYLPELARFDFSIAVHPFTPPVDSADVEPAMWQELVRVIVAHYDRYDGFVVLHGTDTMSYTASALSFMLQGLAKPVILTGSQLPLNRLRTDGKENLITSLEIAAACEPDGRPTVPEVCIFFQNRLWRGCRTTKLNTENFNAFTSFNFPPLATAGVNLAYNREHFLPAQAIGALRPHLELNTNALIITLFPGIPERIIQNVLKTDSLRAVVLKTFGSGNAPQKEWLLRALCEAVERGVVVVNITQCPTGSVEMERYKTGIHLLEAGVVSGHDSTVEAAITKLMVLLGSGLSTEEIRTQMNRSLCGEISLE